jgi:urocanate hydratase
VTITARGSDRADEMIQCVSWSASELGVGRSADARCERTLARAAQAGLDRPCA